jgi:hypothetical protein
MSATRRQLLAGSAAAIGLGVAGLDAGSVALAAPVAGGLAKVPQVRSAALAWLATLAPAEQARARFALESSTWRGWNYMGISLIKPGLRFEEMNQPQREAGMALLASVLSPAGIDKADRVRHLQDVLSGGNRALRNSDRFSIAIFGEPDAGKAWGWRLEGHHLTFSATLLGDTLLSVTPSSFSCNPNEVTSGPRRGMVALTEEEQLARRLFADLAGSQRRRALIAETPIRNTLALAGRENRFTTREGLPAADMRDAQRELLWALIDTYAVSHLAGEIGAAQAARVREGDQFSVHFAWAGGNTRGTPLYYRLHGPTFVIELAAVDDAAQHLHTIYHDVPRTLGRHVVG